MLALLLLACSGKGPSDSAGPDNVPWTAAGPDLSVELGTMRGLAPRRAIVHLHSPYSHDACDGNGLPEGAVNQECLDDFRAGLCTARVDVAFQTDHPAHAAEQAWEDLFHLREGDEAVWDGEDLVANRMDCGDGHRVTLMAGIEDELMPVGLHDHVAGTPEDNDAAYNDASPDTVSALRDAGAVVLLAHTEGRDDATIEAQRAAGLAGAEIFNLHAMFAPDIREEDLGLDPYGWVSAIEPFTSPEGTGEPDLLFLGVLEEQAVTVERVDRMLATGPFVVVGGTDAHQNVLPLDLRDGDRMDSFRRMAKWFANVLWVAGDEPADYQAALASGRAWLVFDLLGVPAGLDFHLEADRVYEVGETAPAGTLVLTCPVLSPGSSRGEKAPEIAVTLYRDGEPWQTSCGEFDAGPGVYRVRVDVTPHHLEPFLGEDPTAWLKPYPWVYTNAIRVE